MPNQAEQDRSGRFTFSQRVLALRVQPDAPSADLQATCQRAVEAGFGGVELPVPLLMGNPGLPVPVRANSSPKSVLTGPVAVLCTTCGSSDVDRATSDIAAALGLAGRYGARCLNVALPSLAPGMPSARAVACQSSLNLAFELLHALRFEAEQAGVTLALEAGVGGALQSPVELRELVDAANSWAVGACIDVNLIARAGSPEDWIITLGRRVHAIRVTLPAAGAASAGKTGSTATDPGLDHAAIIRAIETVGFEGVLIVAGDGPAESVLAEARQYGYLDVR